MNMEKKIKGKRNFKIKLVRLKGNLGRAIFCFRQKITRFSIKKV